MFAFVQCLLLNSALLWHRLMGKRVLEVHGLDASPYLRPYAHCSKGRVMLYHMLIFLSLFFSFQFPLFILINMAIVIILLQVGVTLLLINLSNQTNFIINVYNHTNIKLKEKEKRRGESPFMCSLKAKVGSNGESLMREEYHLSPEDGNLRSQTSLLNGNPLNVSNGELPRLDPIFCEEHAPIYVAPLSIAFIVIPNFEAPACA
jgi:heparanase 1